MEGTNFAVPSNTLGCAYEFLRSQQNWWDRMVFVFFAHRLAVWAVSRYEAVTQMDLFSVPLWCGLQKHCTRSEPGESYQLSRCRTKRQGTGCSKHHIANQVQTQTVCSIKCVRTFFEKSHPMFFRVSTFAEQITLQQDTPREAKCRYVKGHQGMTALDWDCFFGLICSDRFQ